MIGMDWLGFIFFACTVTGSIYVLIIVDYFSRFVWAKPYRDYTRVETIDMYETHLAPIFGYPETAYSDNGSYFVNGDVQRLFKEYGVVRFTGPISHPSSTGLRGRGQAANGTEP